MAMFLELRKIINPFRRPHDGKILLQEDGSFKEKGASLKIRAPLRYPASRQALTITELGSIWRTEFSPTEARSDEIVVES
jgi:hypothetical protein